MTKIQLELTEEENKMLELIKVQLNLDDKRKAIGSLIHKYSLGWLPSQGGRVWQQTLLEAVIDKVMNHPYWREFTHKHTREEILKEIRETFDLDEVQLKKVTERLTEMKLFKK